MATEQTKTITPRERMLRVLRHEETDRLPICPVGLSPFTRHAEFPAYGPILEVAKRSCEFMASYPLPGGNALCDPAIWKTDVHAEEEGERKTRTTVLHTPRGDLVEVRVHDRSVGSWATKKAFVNSEEELRKLESLAFEPVPIKLDGLAELQKKVGDAGLVYCNGIRSAMLTATWGMSEEFRTVFCYTERERLRTMVERAQERLLDYVTRLLDCGAGPVFRWYSIEEFVEPVMPPSFVDEFIVPYDREVVSLIHARGCYVVMHCHGRLGAQIERMVKIGVRGVDCVESPPQNDIDLAGMFEKADGRLFLWGYIQFEDLARKTPEQIEELVRRAVDMGGKTGRYVLSQAASPWTAELSPRVQENWIRMITAGVKYGW